MKKEKHLSAGELSRKALKDSTKYDPLEIGHAMTADTMEQIRTCIEKHDNIIAENEYCIVRQIATDPLLHNLKRIKYYAWLYLPKPRPNQAVFLYNRNKNTIQRLWVLPDAMKMATLASNIVVNKEDETMQAWSLAFFMGTFWDFIRHQHDIKMPSEQEFFLANREELIKAGCKIPDANSTDPFDFSKIAIEKVVDPEASTV